MRLIYRFWPRNNNLHHMPATVFAHLVEQFMGGCRAARRQIQLSQKNCSLGADIATLNFEHHTHRGGISNAEP